MNPPNLSASSFRSERRQQARPRVRGEAIISRPGLSARAIGWLRNLSNAGALIETGSPSFAIGDVLSLQLRLPDSPHLLACTAVVRHTYGERGLGVEFTDLTAEARDRLCRVGDADTEPKVAPGREPTKRRRSSRLP